MLGPEQATGQKEGQCGSSGYGPGGCQPAEHMHPTWHLVMVMPAAAHAVRTQMACSLCAWTPDWLPGLSDFHILWWYQARTGGRSSLLPELPRQPQLPHAIQREIRRWLRLRTQFAACRMTCCKDLTTEKKTVAHFETLTRQKTSGFNRVFVWVPAAAASSSLLPVWPVR